MNRVLHAFAELPRAALLMPVRGYRLLLKPWLGNACRFEPSCSQYALTALQRHGATLGGALTTYRLLRCHPWCDGGWDPVPEHVTREAIQSGLFARLGLGADATPLENSDDHGIGACAPARTAYREPAP